MAKKLTGGGILGSKNVNVGVRTGLPRKGSSPASADQLGQSTAFPKENVEARSAYNSGVKLGNEKALDVGPGGCGTGRTVMRSGSQGTYGPVAGKPRTESRDILSQFGPDIPGRK
jgi:hypothetical protein